MARLLAQRKIMVELLPDFPPHVAAYVASQKVDKDEYESVVVQRVNEVAKHYGKINFLVRLETDFDNYTFAAFIDYLKVSFRHFTQWNRMAIVTDERWVRIAYDALSAIVPGKIIGYKISEFDAAKKWVSEPFGN